MIRAAVLFVVWVGLWGQVSVANVLSGVVVVAAVLWLFPPDRQMRHRVHPLALVTFLLHLLWALVVSSVKVAVATVAPTPARTRTEIVEVPLSTPSEMVAAVMANSITLTPGTMTVDVSESSSGTLTLAVHVFGFGDHQSFAEEMAVLERRILAALEPIAGSATEAAT
jgi:multicomponent Na+:H+ antiporter subunit E